jgi:hypothetical protein
LSTTEKRFPSADFSESPQIAKHIKLYPTTGSISSTGRVQTVTYQEPYESYRCQLNSGGLSHGPLDWGEFGLSAIARTQPAFPINRSAMRAELLSAAVRSAKLLGRLFKARVVEG